MRRPDSGGTQSAGDARILLRRAVPAEARSLTRIAHRSKGYWGYPRGWLRLWRSDLTLTAAYVESTPVFCALCGARGGSIAGFCAAADRGAGVWEIEHLWVLPGHVRRGIGTLLFRKAMAEARSGGALSLRVVSDPHAEGFYLRLGGRRAYTVPSRPAGRVLPVLFVDVEPEPGDPGQRVAGTSAGRYQSLERQPIFRGVPGETAGRQQVEVRVAGELRPGDVGRIVELHGVLYALEWGFDSTFEAYVAEALARFALIRIPRERLWLVEEGGALMGCLAIVRASDEEAQLRWFLVHPALRGQGLGKRLLGEAIAFCRECGYRRVILWTVSQLQAAGHLYAGAGFRVVEQKTGRLWGQSVTEQRYLLELG